MATARAIKLTSRKSPARLTCTACGASAEASCNCNAPYLPAGQLAEAAIATHPELSDRAIAEQIGVDHKTVAKARTKATGENSPVEKRVGKDGKKRRMPTPNVSAKKNEEADADSDPVDQELQVAKEWFAECKAGLTDKERALVEKARPVAAKHFLLSVVRERNQLRNEVAKLQQALIQGSRDSSSEFTDGMIPPFMIKGHAH